jgi:hypothetical protein
VSLGVGIGFAVASNKATRDASSAPTIDGYEALVDKGKSRKTIAIIGIGAGSALIAAGIWRYVMVRGSASEARRSRPQLVGWVDGRRGGLLVTGSL